MPPWSFTSVENDHETIRLAGGRWQATDGGHQADAIDIGRVSSDETAEIELQRTPDGLARFTMGREGGSACKEIRTEIVVDSGCILVCCEDEFVASALTGRASVEVLRAARKHCPRADVVAAYGSQGSCVCVILEPAFGDGTYSVVQQFVDGKSVLAIDVGRSR